MRRDPSRSHAREGGANARSSTIFSRRSLGLSSASYRLARRTTSGPVEPPYSVPAQSTRSMSHVTPRTFDPLALVRRLPGAVRSFGYVKSARNLAVFSRFERFWLELRGAIVVMIVDDDLYSHPRGVIGSLPGTKEQIIAGVFTVEQCQVTRARSAKNTLLRLSKTGHSQHIWLRFDDETECDLWEKAIHTAATRRVVGISDFEFISPIGKGASGKVFLVTDRKTGEKLALKVIDKTKVFESRSGFRHALDERLALEMVDGHPFFSRLRYAFQTRAFFYLAIDFYDGGDLYQYLRTHQGRLRESLVQSVAAEVALALEHLHRLGFVYRDLKPENVLLDSKGHVRLADFGLCKLLPSNTLTNTICGTHTYAAPEMLAVRNYGISIDLWAFGVFVYHILRGRTPYEARDLDQVIANMNNRRIRFSSNTSPELVSMIKKLLDWNPETRLGCGPTGMLEVRGHSFFKGMDWRKVYLREHDGDGLFLRTGKSNSTRIRPVPSMTEIITSSETKETDDPNPSAAQSGVEGGDTNKAENMPSDPTLVGSTSKARKVGSSSEKVTSSYQAEYGARIRSTGTDSEENEAPQKVASKSKRIIRPKSLGNIGSPRSKKANRAPPPAIDQSLSISLRDRMVAAAEQDDLRNFDMSEWGKISVDNDHDDVNYGDGSLWPISKARRRLVEDERMIAGFSYSSTSTPFALPDNL